MSDSFNERREISGFPAIFATLACGSDPSMTEEQSRMEGKLSSELQKLRALLKNARQDSSAIRAKKGDRAFCHWPKRLLQPVEVPNTKNGDLSSQVKIEMYKIAVTRC